MQSGGTTEDGSANQECTSHDEEALEISRQINSGVEVRDWALDDEGNLYLSKKLFVPIACRDEVLKELHSFSFAVHPGSTKMYRDLI